MNLKFTESQWENYAKTNKIIFSSCRDCVFFKSPEECSCGRLEKFTNISVDIVDDDNNVQYKVINGRICNMYRTGDWLKALKISDKSNSHIKNIARKEVQVKCSFVIICDDNEDTRKITDEKELRAKSKEKISLIVETMKSVLSSSIEPEEIIFLNESWIKPYDFINYLRIQCKENNIKCKWRLEHFGDFSAKDPSNRDDNLKNVLKTITKGYCSIFFNGEIVGKNYLEEIDDKLNDKLKPFLLIKPSEGISGIVINSVLFKQFFSNKNSYTIESFIKQVEKVSKEQKCPHLIQQLAPPE